MPDPAWTYTFLCLSAFAVRAREGRHAVRQPPHFVQMLAVVGGGFVHTGLPADAPFTGRVFRNDPLAKHLPRGGVTRAGEPPQLAVFGLRSLRLVRRLPPMILHRALALAVACLAVHFIRDREHGRILESLRELPPATAADMVGNETGQHGREAE